MKKSKGAEVGVGSCCVGSSIICAMCKGHGRRANGEKGEAILILYSDL